MKTLKFLMIFIILLFLGLRCEDWLATKWVVRLKNNSDKKVYFAVSFEWDGHRNVPSVQWPDPNYSKLTPAFAHDMGEFILNAGSIETRNADSVAVFVFDPDTLHKYTWEEIKQENNCLKIFKMKYKDLPVGAGTLNYP